MALGSQNGLWDICNLPFDFRHQWLPQSRVHLNDYPKVPSPHTVGCRRVGEENLGTPQTWETGAATRGRSPAQSSTEALLREEARSRRGGRFPPPRCFFAVGEFEEVPAIFALTRKAFRAGRGEPAPTISCHGRSLQGHEPALAARDRENPKPL